MPNFDRWPHTPFKGELANFRTARSDVASSTVDIMYWGNSLTQGPTDPVAGGFPARVGNMLNARLGKQHGVGYEPCRTNQTTSRWTLTNTSGNSVSNLRQGFGQWTCQLAAGDTLSLTTTFDRVELLYSKTQTGGGTINVKIDGVDATNLTTLDSNLTTTYDYSNSWVSNSQTNASHTLLLTNTGSNAVYVEGAYFYNTNYSSGYRVWNGARAGDWGSLPTEANGAFDIIADKTPDLAVWCHFYNDKNPIFYPLEDYYGTWIDRFVEAVRERSPNTDILLCSEWQTTAWLASYNDYDEMRALMISKAAEHGVAYLDAGDFLEPTGFDNTTTDPFNWENADKIHQEPPQGFQQFANIHYAFLTDNKPPSRPQGYPDAGGTTPMSNILTGWTTDPVHGFWVEDPSWTPPADGAAVDSWRNGGTAGGGNLTSSGSNRPVYRAVAPVSDGQSALQFTSASSQRMVVDITDLAQTYWIVALVSTGGSNGAAERIVGIGANTGYGFGDNATNVYAINGGTQITGGTSDSSAHCYVAKFAGASSTLHVDGVLRASGNAGTSSLTVLSVGAGNSSTSVFANYLNGFVHAVLIFDTDPTAQAEWDSFKAYAATLGITIV